MPVIMATIASVAAAAVIACSDSAAPATPGTLSLTITTPNSDDRALRLTITGAPVTSLDPPAGITLLHREAPGNTLALAFGNITSGMVFHLTVPDVAKAESYHATIDEASDATHALRSSLASYSASISR